jgi:hypothetical protein
MSAPQLTDANSSGEWFRTVKEPGARPQRSPSEAAIDVKQRRQRFVRLVTYTMGGLVAFTLLGVASFAWRQHSMKVALAAPVPVPAVVAAMQPASLTPAAPPPASETTTEAVPAPPKPVAAAVRPPTAKKSAAASAVAKAKPAIKSPARPSPFLGAKKPPVKTR